MDGKLLSDGREHDVVIHEINIDIEYGCIGDMYGSEISTARNETFTLRGKFKIGEGMYGEDKMCETACRDEGVAREIARADMSDDQKLLEKHNIVNVDGTLTQVGIAALAQVLFKDAATHKKIVQAMKVIDKKDK